MPMPRKPTALKKLDGSIKDHPGRQNQDEPIPLRGIGPAPKSMPECKRMIWDEIVSIMYKGVLGEADRLSLEIMTDLMYRFRLAPIDEPGLTGAELARLTGLLSEFGMTPSSRTKIVVPKAVKQNPFESL